MEKTVQTHKQNRTQPGKVLPENPSSPEKCKRWRKANIILKLVLPVKQKTQTARKTRKHSPIPSQISPENTCTGKWRAQKERDYDPEKHDHVVNRTKLQDGANYPYLAGVNPSAEISENSWIQVEYNPDMCELEETGQKTQKIFNRNLTGEGRSRRRRDSERREQCRSVETKENRAKQWREREKLAREHSKTSPYHHQNLAGNRPGGERT